MITIEVLELLIATAGFVVGYVVSSFLRDYKQQKQQERFDNISPYSDIGFNPDNPMNRHSITRANSVDENGKTWYEIEPYKK